MLDPTGMNARRFRNLRRIFVTAIFVLIALPSFAAPFAYLGGDNVIVVDTATNTEVTTISPNGYAFDKVIVHPSGNFIYVPVSPTGRSNPAFLEVYNTSNNSLVTTIPIGISPGASTIDSSGDFIYVQSLYAQIGGGPRIISVINTSTNTVAATIELDQTIDGAIHLAVHPTGHTLYVGASTAGTITAFDTNTLQPTATINVGSNFNDLAIHPSGQYIYTAGSTLKVIDTTTNSVTNTIAINGNGKDIAVHPDGNTIYVSDFTGSSISVIDTNTNTVTTTVSTPFPTDLSVHPSGNFVYATGFMTTTNGLQGIVSVLNTASNQIIDTISTSTIPYTIAVGPTPEPVGGTAAGISAISVTCTNATSGQSISIGLGNAAAWDCESSGLQVNTGDSIEMVVIGTAD